MAAVISARRSGYTGYGAGLSEHEHPVDLDRVQRARSAQLRRAAALRVTRAAAADESRADSDDGQSIPVHAAERPLAESGTTAVSASCT